MNIIRNSIVSGVSAFDEFRGRPVLGRVQEVLATPSGVRLRIEGAGPLLGRTVTCRAEDCRPHSSIEQAALALEARP